jgi:hypothetical protein
VAAADIGTVICGDDTVVLTGLGNILARAAAARSSESDVD